MTHDFRGFYVTGTDTGAGKTFASVALLHAMRRGDARAVGMKPVASGCQDSGEGFRNDDALALQQASDPQPDYALVNPYALPEPTAPQLAAAAAGVQVRIEPMLAAFDQLQAVARQVVVEGVGGWLAPLADDLEQAALVRALNLPVILVVGLRLGCLNHARLTARAIQEDGCRLVGWIGNDVTSGEPFPARYFELLTAALPIPCLGRLAHGAGTEADQAGKLSLD